MITYDQNGVTLHYTDASGNAASVSPFNPTLYSQISAALNAQQAAATQDQQAVTNYNGEVAAYNTSVNAGRTPAPLPPAPMMTVVSDMGAVSAQPFPAGTFLAVATAAAQTPSGFAGVNPTYNSDALSVLITLITNQQALLNRIVTKLGA